MDARAFKARIETYGLEARIKIYGSEDVFWQSASTQNSHARRLENKGEAQEAITYYEIWKDYFPPIQYNLGRCLFDGIGIKQDQKAAFAWFKKAAEHNIDYAQFAIAECFYEGKGVEKDVKQAVEWYQKAAEQDCCAAQCCLAYCLFYGIGVQKNTQEAIQWFRKAAKQDHLEAQYFLGNCLLKGTEAAEAEQRPAKPKYKFNHCGYSIEQTRKDDAWGVKKDQNPLSEIKEDVKTNEALIWIHVAAAREHPEAVKLLNELSAKKAKEQKSLPENHSNTLPSLPGFEYLCQRETPENVFIFENGNLAPLSIKILQEKRKFFWTEGVLFPTSALPKLKEHPLKIDNPDAVELQLKFEEFLESDSEERHNLALEYIDDVVEFGTVAIKEMQKGDIATFYAGVMPSPECESKDPTYQFGTSVYEPTLVFSIQDRKYVNQNIPRGWSCDAKGYGNDSRFIAHAPKQEELDDADLPAAAKEESSVQNIKFDHAFRHNVGIKIGVVIKNIKQFERAYTHYGTDYWKKPFWLFNKKTGKRSYLVRYNEEGRLVLAKPELQEQKGLERGPVTASSSSYLCSIASVMKKLRGALTPGVGVTVSASVDEVMAVGPSKDRVATPIQARPETVVSVSAPLHLDDRSYVRLPSP